MYGKIVEGKLVFPPYSLSITKPFKEIVSEDGVDKEIIVDKIITYHGDIPEEVYFANGYYLLVNQLIPNITNWWETYSEPEYQVNDEEHKIYITYTLVNKSVNELKECVLEKINEYDTSSNVNIFYLNRLPTWFDKAMRIGLVNLISCAELLNQTSIDLAYNGQTLTLPLTSAKLMFAEIEVYASKCYNTTEFHKSQINSFTNAQDIISYDYTRGYPDNKPSFIL